MYTAGSTPCAVGMSLGAITDDSGGLWSRGHPLGLEAGIGGGGPDIDAYSSGGHFRAETFYFLGCTLPI